MKVVPFPNASIIEGELHDLVFCFVLDDGGVDPLHRNKMQEITTGL